MTSEEGFNTEQEYNPFRSTSSQQTYDQELDTYYNRDNYNNYYKRNNISSHCQQQPKVRPTQNNVKQIRQTQRRNNPCDRNGIQLRCHICNSIYHMAQNCLEKCTLYAQEVVLYQSDFDHPEQSKTLFSESWNPAAVVSGFTNTLAGKAWYNCCIASLSKNKKQKIKHHAPENTYRFGDGKLLPALQNVNVPISLGN